MAFISDCRLNKTATPKWLILKCLKRTMQLCIVAGTWLKLVPIIAHGVPVLLKKYFKNRCGQFF